MVVIKELIVNDNERTSKEINDIVKNIALAEDEMIVLKPVKRNDVNVILICVDKKKYENYVYYKTTDGYILGTSDGKIYGLRR